VSLLLFYTKINENQLCIATYNRILFFQVKNKSHVKSNVCAFILKPRTDANSNEVIQKINSSVSAHCKAGEANTSLKTAS
jgi:hypothetical protein